MIFWQLHLLLLLQVIIYTSRYDFTPLVRAGSGIRGRIY